jgi:hypothetical protein
MDELGFFHLPLRGIRGGALLPKKHELNGNCGNHVELLPVPQYVRGTSEGKNIGVQAPAKDL